jgi:hypothetical protein
MVSRLSSLECVRAKLHFWFVPLLLLAAVSCKKSESPKPAPEQPVAPKAPDIAPSPTEPHVPMGQPVAFWQHGKTERVIDGATAAREYLVFDLGEAWTPYLFADATKVDGTPVASGYKSTYLTLARGEFPHDLHGERAREDKYLELYGILPTLSVVRARMLLTSQHPCTDEIDFTPLENYAGLETYSNNVVARKSASDFAAQKARVATLLEQQNVATVEELDLTPLNKRDQDTVAKYRAILPVRIATEAVQKRLKCEGYLTGRGKVITGVLDWATHEGLAEFEKRNRVFSWGFIGKDSLVPLRMLPMEADREGLLRVLTERAVHAAGVIEDGSTTTLASGQPRTWRDVAGKEHPIPNLVAQLRETIIDAFGLHTPESTLAFLQGLGELSADGHRYVAIKYPALPEYYNARMELTLDYDRGDVWYDFPFDAKGQEIAQPVNYRPNVTIAVMYAGQKIPLARFGTTIGGWRTESVNGVAMWKYKESPPGPRAWEEIVAAPVWLPPDSTPPEDLMVKNPEREKPTDPELLVNYHETGPSYASAYGLVAAYHREFFKRADGTVLIGRDEGIRTHGSVDYMSIMRRHSHGCHRLHNHIALRMMSFVLAHRPHEHLGQETLGYKKFLNVNGKSYLMDIRQGGYVFKLQTPLYVNVEEGRIRGQAKHAIDFAIPKWNVDANAYVMPDGSTVQVRGDKLITLTPPVAAAAGASATSARAPGRDPETTLHTAVLPAEARR